MTRVHRSGVEFDVVLRNNDTVWLAHSEPPYWRHHGTVCRYERTHTHRLVLVQLHSGIFAELQDQPPEPRLLTREEAMNAVVDRWAALNPDKLPQPQAHAERTDQVTSPLHPVRLPLNKPDADMNVTQLTAIAREIAEALSERPPISLDDDQLQAIVADLSSYRVERGDGMTTPAIVAHNNSINRLIAPYHEELTDRLSPEELGISL